MIRSVLCILLLWPMVLGAVEPDEVLADPVLEERAREISKGLRCPVCQNESIDESHANIAGDLRLLVRDRLVAGDSDQDVVNFVVARYGEFVLLKPTTGGGNWLLWAAGPMMLLFALAMAILYLRSRDMAKAPLEQALTVQEEARLKAILKE
ncbi:MAG: cytochrome c-type biogenesis protein [Roseobacter sp.]